jgi:hypothetical protein
MASRHQDPADRPPDQALAWVPYRSGLSPACLTTLRADANRDRSPVLARITAAPTATAVHARPPFGRTRADVPSSPVRQGTQRERLRQDRPPPQHPTVVIQQHGDLLVLTQINRQDRPIRRITARNPSIRPAHPTREDVPDLGPSILRGPSPALDRVRSETGNSTTTPAPTVTVPPAARRTPTRTAPTTPPTHQQTATPGNPTSRAAYTTPVDATPDNGIEGLPSFVESELSSSAVRRGEQPPWIVPDGPRQRIEPRRGDRRPRPRPGRRRPRPGGVGAGSAPAGVRWGASANGG